MVQLTLKLRPEKKKVLKCGWHLVESVTRGDLIGSVRCARPVPGPSFYSNELLEHFLAAFEERLSHPIMSELKEKRI